MVTLACLGKRSGSFYLEIEADEWSKQMTLYLVLMLVFIVAVGICGLRGTAPK